MIAGSGRLIPEGLLNRKMPTLTSGVMCLAQVWTGRRFLWKLVLPPKIKEISFFLMAFFYCVGILSLLRPVVSASHRTTLLCMLYSGVLTLFKFGACLLVPFQRLGSWDVRPLIGTNPFLRKDSDLAALLAILMWLLWGNRN